MPPSDQHLDALLRALADATRRTLLDRLRDAPGLTLGELIDGLPQSRQALSKHLAVLEEAELVVPVWRGREKRHFLNPAPLQALPARWVTTSARQEAAALLQLRQALPTPPDAAGAGAVPAPPWAPPAGAAPASAPLPPAGADDAIARLLLQPPAPALQGQPILQAERLAEARAYLADTLAAVQALLQALGADEGYQLPDAASDPSGFSLAAHLAHLADIETLGWRERFARVLDSPQPVLPGVDGDRLAIEHRYQQRPWRGAARRFVAHRRQSLALLARWDVQTLRRPVVFGGARTRAGGVLAAAVAHDLDHRPAMARAWLQRPPGPAPR